MFGLPAPHVWPHEGSRDSHTTTLWPPLLTPARASTAAFLHVAGHCHFPLPLTGSKIDFSFECDDATTLLLAASHLTAPDIMDRMTIWLTYNDAFEDLNEISPVSVVDVDCLRCDQWIND